MGSQPAPDRVTRPGDDRGGGRPLVIVNPKAGSGITQKKWARMVGAVSDGLGEIEVRFTEARGHATEIAHDEALRGRSLLVAFGGDGTISEVAGGLLAAREAGARGTELGIIPRGTGGDFRRTLQLPTDVADAARHVRDRPARIIDVGRAIFSVPGGDAATRYFVNTASFGFSSVVASRANNSSKAFGAKMAFVGATLNSLVNYQNVDVMLAVDDGPQVRRTLLFAALGNGRFFGGGMEICPDADVSSGHMSLVTIGDLSKMRVLVSIPRIFTGSHLSIPGIEATDVRKLRAAPAETDQVIPIEVDGETPGILPATFEVIPAALPVRF